MVRSERVGGRGHDFSAFESIVLILKKGYLSRRPGRCLREASRLIKWRQLQGAVFKTAMLLKYV
jgi:hypothetical protein